MNVKNLEDDEFELLFGEGPSQTIVEESPDESPIEEVVSVKRKYVKRRQSAKKNDKDVNEPWTPEEEFNEKKLRCRQLQIENRIRPKISQFCETYNSKKSRHESEVCDEEVEETRPVGRDNTKRMGSTSVARSTSSSAAADTGLVDTLLSKFT
ncbi:hypothetical protein Tco_1539036 [Tanacetum coccineum]